MLCIFHHSSLHGISPRFLIENLRKFDILTLFIHFIKLRTVLIFVIIPIPVLYFPSNNVILHTPYVIETINYIFPIIEKTLHITFPFHLFSFVDAAYGESTWHCSGFPRNQTTTVRWLTIGTGRFSILHIIQLCCILLQGPDPNVHEAADQ